ncbi:MAG TPA: ShlB/FhaC/HecB family hemolysin secretion/activation protein [Thermoanaerobaculia bacterium]|nr:ShlB/FhaC/HecB family hemolysin secretion/activation protein [Thermoanaerobaculia bacterium]
MRRFAFIAPLLLLAACGSSGLGDLGGILGSPSTDRPSDIRGVVDYVDTRAQRIDLDVSYINNLREDRQNQSIYYDSRTRVEYRGRSDYRVEQLERGDEISVRGFNDGGRYVADTITVTRSVSG